MNTKRYANLHILAACAAVLISCAGAPPSSSRPTQWDIESRQRIYMAHLREEGYAPRIDEDGDIAFRWEGLDCYIIMVESDPSLMYVLLPSIWTLESDAERIRAANAISVANRRTKVAKAYVSGRENNFVSISTELFLEDPNHFKVIFWRMMGAISTAAGHFVDNM